jgi:predicted membrane channel-forming protein YqfA (hemolysin III family)
MCRRNVLLFAMWRMLFIVWALGVAGLFWFVFHTSDVGAFKSVSVIGFVSACAGWPLIMLALLFLSCNQE